MYVFITIIIYNKTQIFILLFLKGFINLNIWDEILLRIHFSEFMWKSNMVFYVSIIRYRFNFKLKKGTVRINFLDHSKNKII